MTNKQTAEQNALQSIKIIVDALGENSYVGAAMQGVWETAQANIDAESVVGTADVVNELIADAGAKEMELMQLRTEIRGLRRELAEAERELDAAHVERDSLDQDLTLEIETLLKEREEILRILGGEDLLSEQTYNTILQCIEARKTGLTGALHNVGLAFKKTKNESMHKVAQEYQQVLNELMEVERCEEELKTWHACKED